MAKTVLRNTARGARGIRTASGDLVMIEGGATSAPLDIDAAELKDNLVENGGSFEKAKASEAAEEADAGVLGEPGPGDPPVPEDEPENEVAAPEASGRRARR